MIIVKVVTSERFDVTNANFVVTVVNLDKDKVDGIIEANLLIKENKQEIVFFKGVSLCKLWSVTLYKVVTSHTKGLQGSYGSSGFEVKKMH